jgi:hypothetical protein
VATLWRARLATDSLPQSTRNRGIAMCGDF